MFKPKRKRICDLKDDGPVRGYVEVETPGVCDKCRGYGRDVLVIYAEVEEDYGVHYDKLRLCKKCIDAGFKDLKEANTNRQEYISGFIKCRQQLDETTPIPEGMFYDPVGDPIPQEWGYTGNIRFFDEEQFDKAKE